MSGREWPSCLRLIFGRGAVGRRPFPIWCCRLGSGSGLGITVTICIRPGMFCLGCAARSYGIRNDGARDNGKGTA